MLQTAYYEFMKHTNVTFTNAIIVTMQELLGIINIYLDLTRSVPIIDSFRSCTDKKTLQLQVLYKLH